MGKYKVSYTNYLGIRKSVNIREDTSEKAKKKVKELFVAKNVKVRKIKK